MAATHHAGTASLSTRRREWTKEVSNDLALFVHEAGDPGARPVLFVHGLASDSSAFEAQLDDARLRAARRLIAVDLRGHGLPRCDAATRSLADAPDPLGVRASDLGTLVDDLDDPIVVGWSFGATVIQRALLDGHLAQAGQIVLLAATCALGPASADDPAGRLVAADVLAALTETAGDGDATAFADVVLRATLPPSETAQASARPGEHAVSRCRSGGVVVHVRLPHVAQPATEP